MRSEQMRILKGIVKFLTVLIVNISLFVYAMFQGGFVSWFLFYSVCLIFVLTFFFSFLTIRRFEVERMIQPSSAKRGEELRVTIKLRRPKFQPFIYFHVKDYLPERIGDAHTTSAFFFFSLKRTFEYHYSINNIKRGKYQFEQVTLTFGDLFGIFERKMKLDVLSSYTVYPNYKQLKDIPTIRKVENTEGKSVAQELGEERSLASIRQYVPGDRLTSIDWKQSARATKLMTKEFETYQGKGTVIVFDPFLKYRDMQQFEKSIELTASLLATFLETQTSVQFAIPQHNWILKEIHSKSLAEGLELLAQAQSKETITNFEQLIEHWNGSAVYYVCTEIDQSVFSAFQRLRQQQIMAQVFLVNQSKEEQSIIESLRKIGVSTHFVRV
ncbi:DUF58 domain-containing protein [Alkalihalobacillus trypoxylicola]|uniref:DUF58 domain-containing protein n=1 Tax=Alkalihalobacillus trypoxylicola TaxID=519424 RepID=UPI0009ED08EC|nr:DUF58 domain-containing protein [Alkalihalobacillus trypoxylicola]